MGQDDDHEFEYIAHDNHYPSGDTEGQCDYEGPHGKNQTQSRNKCEEYNVFGAASCEGRHHDEDYRPTPPPGQGGVRQGSMLVEHRPMPEVGNTIEDIACEFIY
jgi:hypothetical protein